MGSLSILRGLYKVCSYQSKVLHTFVVARRLSTSPVAMASKLDIGGIYPPIATPFDSDENIDWTKLKENLDKWNKIDFRGYVVQGSNGEYAFLNKEERVEMVSRVRQMTPEGKLVIAGSGCESTRDTIEMSQRMADAGANAVLVVTPCYYKGQMTNQVLQKHFEKVADKSPVPVILYSVPGNTGIDLSPEVVITLSEHPNIIGLKDSGGDITKLGAMVYKTKDHDFQILAGSASFLFPALSLGCVGGVCALANVLGEEVCQLQRLFEQGKIQEAQLLQQRLIAPNTGVTKRFGVPGLKQAMSWFGYHGGPLRSPLLPLGQQDVEALKQAFVTTGFLNK